MTNTGVNTWRTFKDELTQGFIFGHSYKQPGQLEGRLVVDLAQKLPIYMLSRNCWIIQMIVLAALMIQFLIA